MGNLVRVGIFEIKDVLPFVVRDKRDAGAIRSYGEHKVKMWSMRYQTFQKSLSCGSCGVTGQYFALEKCADDPGTRFHFNLYAKTANGDEVLITKDHIFPKSKGGGNGLSNMQTMCKVCNEMKRDKMETERSCNDRAIQNES